MSFTGCTISSCSAGSTVSAYLGVRLMPTSHTLTQSRGTDASCSLSRRSRLRVCAFSAGHLCENASRLLTPTWPQDGGLAKLAWNLYATSQTLSFTGCTISSCSAESYVRLHTSRSNVTITVIFCYCRSAEHTPNTCRLIPRPQGGLLMASDCSIGCSALKTIVVTFTSCEISSCSATSPETSASPGVC